MDTFLYLIFPYLCLAVFVVGHYWRYRYDKFGWTTRSSQLYENRLLRWGSPLFHFGLLGVIGGHIVGLVVPEVVDRGGGGQRGRLPLPRGRSAASRRRRHAARSGHPRLPSAHRRPGLLATTRMDKLMYVFLAAVIVLGSGTPWQQHLRPLRLPRGRLAVVPQHLPASSPSPS